ncbi:MAG: aminoacyl--tRNA ligase-related protein [Jatrophihabitans sp.]
MTDEPVVVVDDGQPIPTDAPGVYLFPGSFERVITALRSGIAALAAGEPFEPLAIPPVISRRTIERAGYVKAFPQLLGTVHSYTGDSRAWGKLARLVDAGGDWHAEQQISDLVLLPAACYPVYATLDGAALDGPVKFTVAANCFRQEATSETGRLRSFRMVELVTAAPEDYCMSWRGGWLDRVGGWLTDLGLQVSIEVADDPFFGPARKLFQAAQRAQELKLELKVAVSPDRIQAVASANYHKDHFGETFGFTFDGEVGHTACIAFGMERIVLALITVHGPAIETWPAAVRSLLDGRS